MECLEKVFRIFRGV